MKHLWLFYIICLAGGIFWTLVFTGAWILCLPDYITMCAKDMLRILGFVTLMLSIPLGLMGVVLSVAQLGVWIL